MSAVRVGVLAALLLVALPARARAEVAFHAQSQVTDVLTSAANTTTLAHATALAVLATLLAAIAVVRMRGRRALLSTLVAALILALAAEASGQAVFDAQSSSAAGLTSGTPTKTLAHTTTAAPNRLLLVSIGMNIRNATGTTVASVTYGGAPLTRLNAITDVGPDTRTEVWYLLAPPAGASNVVVTATGITPGQSVKTLVGATTFSNAAAGPPASEPNSGTGSPATVSIAAASTDTIVDFVAARESVTLTALAAQTVSFNASTDPVSPTNDDLQAASSRRAPAGPSTAMSWTLSANRRWSIVAVNVKRATADVEVTQSATPDPVVPGGTLTYRFVVRNQGAATATGVVLTDILPAATTFIAAATTQGSCGGGPAVGCALGTLAVGQQAVVTIAVVAPLAPGPIPANTGVISSTTADPGSPNSASASALVVPAPLVCAPQPGKDGAGGLLGGIVNAYWPGTASAAAGAPAITLGPRRGAAVSITAGDLVLVIQMQDAEIAFDNDDRYGSGAGTPGAAVAPGAGLVTANNAGRYEYAVAASTLGAAGGTLSLGSGLLFDYTNAGATATAGQRRFQVVRVPQYASATLGPTLTASTWNGTSGGVLALDVAGTLGLGATTVSVEGRGFRGGAGRPLTGGTGSNTDYRSAATGNAHGIKGEGIAGTPEHVLDGGVVFDTGPQGYPSGDYARGAPGNAGGGGTDGHPSANDQNSGGGGGANGGDGGRGGNTWFSNLARGGFGGAAFAGSPGRVVLGGGGGAGSRNGSGGIASSGGAGGGIVLIRAGALSGTGTITASGAHAFNDTSGDGGGGGGAGGAIVLLSRGGQFSGVTLTAHGGGGGDAWRTQAPNGFPGERHGPGGGGGGGFIATNGTASASAAGGAAGITTTANDTFGAQPGAAGTVSATASFDEVAGVATTCAAGPQRIAVSKAFSPATVVQNERSVLTLTLTNPNPAQAISGIAVTDVYPFGLANQDPPSRVNTCGGSLVALVGESSLRLTGGSIAAGGQCAISIGVVSDVAGTYVNTLPAGAVTTANAGRTEAPVSATLVVNVLNQKADPTRPGVFKSFSPGVVGVGRVSTLTITLVNGTASALTDVAFVDPYPGGLVNAPSPNVTSTCGGEAFASPGGASVSLLGGTLPAGSICQVTVAVTGAAATYANVIARGAVQVTGAPPNASPATASLLVSALAPPTVVKSFAPAAVFPGQVSQLTIRVTNPNPAPLVEVSFTDALPPGLTVPDVPDAVWTCEGVPRAFPGASRVGVSEATVPASEVCTLSVLVVAAGPAGTLTNEIAAGAVVSANAPANDAAASARLEVLPGTAPIPIPALSPPALCALAALLAALGWRRHASHSRRRRFKA